MPRQSTATGDRHLKPLPARNAPAHGLGGRKAGGKREGGKRRAESGTGTILTRWGVLDYGSPMPRIFAGRSGGMVFHVLNRGVVRMQLFEKAAD